jgi:tetratricopeptide (TPR) repeat protein
MRVHNSTKLVRLSLTLAATCALAFAEQGILVVHVSDPQDRPIENVRLATQGDGSTGAPTSGPGRTRIKLAAQTRAKTWVTLQIIQPQNLVFVSPWDKRVQVPPFENESENFVPVVLIERGNRLALESGQALVAITSKVNQANSVKANQTGDQRSDQTALQDVAREFGLAPEEVDRAIRAWGTKATDPYEKGLAALYERSYPEASKLLASSLEMREQELKLAQNDVGDAAFFLGSSLYQQGHYRESADAYRKALSVRGEDATTLNNLALSLKEAGDYAGAEPLYRRALAIDEKNLGPEHPYTATNVNNLALLLKTKGDYAGAEPLYRRALAIREKVLGPDHPSTATSLNNLAELLSANGDDAGAEPLYRRALAIREKVLGPDHPSTATSLNNLALMLTA